MPRPVTSLRVPMLLGTLIALAACGSGGGQVQQAVVGQVVPVVRYYDAPANTRLKARGQAIIAADGSQVPTGRWEEWHPNGSRQFERTFVTGNWDRSQYYVEWNDDGSVRDTWTDGQ